MADGSGSGSTAILGVIVGVLILGGLLLFVFGGFPGRIGGDGPDVSVELPAAPAPAPSGN
jgi:hypothetical protein